MIITAPVATEPHGELALGRAAVERARAGAIDDHAKIIDKRCIGCTRCAETIAEIFNRDEAGATSRPSAGIAATCIASTGVSACVSATGISAANVAAAGVTASRVSAARVSAPGISGRSRSVATRNIDLVIACQADDHRAVDI